MQIDAYSGYSFAHDNEHIVSLGCFAHARRPFAELVKIAKKTGLAYEAIQYFQKLYAIKKHARENHLSPRDRYFLRKEKALPILNEFKIWLEKNIMKVPKQHRMGQGMHYCLKPWQALIGYLKDGRLEIDNNGVENLIRPLALGRKNFLFAGSPKGATAAAIFYSLIATCNINAVEPHQYFCFMLHHIRLCKSSDDYRKLLPQFIQF